MTVLTPDYMTRREKLQESAQRGEVGSMRVVIGVDSGGSSTRAVALNERGETVGSGVSKGGNPAHNNNFRANIQGAIAEAAANSGIENVVALVAGIAGYDGPEDLEWVERATAVEGLKCVRIHENDAIVAHYGAFGGGPGIVSIQGTGSMITAINGAGKRLLSGQLGHYARAGAVWIGMRCLFALVSEDSARLDPELAQAAFGVWKIDSKQGLWNVLLAEGSGTSEDRSKRFGEFAASVTRHAERGNVTASQICDQAASEIAVGITLLAPWFESTQVPVTLIGSCVRSGPLKSKVTSLLSGREDFAFTIVEPAHDPVMGAALMAARRAGFEFDPVPGIRR